MRVAAPILVGMLVVGFWQFACWFWDVPAYLFPAPSAIAVAFADGYAGLLHALWQTLQVTLAAFALSAVLGTLVAFLFVQSRLIEVSLLPYVVVLQVTPIVAVAPLIIILVKDVRLSLILCATVIALFPVISNTTVGLRRVDPGLLAYFRMNKAGRLATLWRLRIPGALPFFLAGLRISSGLSLVGAVVAEFVAGTGGTGSGLAFEILSSGFQQDIARMFAALLLITLAGLALFSLMVWLERAVLGHWHAGRADAEA